MPYNARSMNFARVMEGLNRQPGRRKHASLTPPDVLQAHASRPEPQRHADLKIDSRYRRLNRVLNATGPNRPRVCQSVLASRSVQTLHRLAAEAGRPVFQVGP